MALRSGIDTVAVVSQGVYTETYVTSTGGGNIASLFATKGFLESAPDLTIRIINIVMSYIRRREDD